MRSPVNPLPLVALVLLAGCGGDKRPAASVPHTGQFSGPAADYPMVIGAPFVVDGVTYTPADTLNYDQVGHAGVSSAEPGGTRIAAAHRTLPVPSYVEVTALDSGRTILVRIERRGPMTGARLLDLSPAAGAQLGLSDNASTPVRVRRVNPSEPERAMLRRGERAPERMETPRPLLAVLSRKLGQSNAMAQAGAGAGVTLPAVKAPQRAPAVAVRPVEEKPAVAPPRAVTATAVTEPKATVVRERTPPPVTRGAFIVQAGAFGSRDRAEAVARRIGGQASQAGAFWRVRTGPYATRAQADAALAQVRASGYTDARIQGVK